MKESVISAFFRVNQGPEDYAYVLLDPLAQPAPQPMPLVDTLRAQLGDEALTRILRPDLSYSPQSCPALVCLAHPGETPLPAMLDLTEEQFAADAYRCKRSICGWLVSEQPAEAIAAHLLKLCSLPTAHGETRFYPIFEPIRLELFWAHFASRKNGPWWPIKHWLVPTSGGEHRRLVGDPARNGSAPQNASETQEDAPLVIRLLSTWRRLLHESRSPLAQKDPFDVPLPALAAQLTQEKIAEARAIGRITPEEIACDTLQRLSICKEQLP